MTNVFSFEFYYGFSYFFSFRSGKKLQNPKKCTKYVTESMLAVSIELNYKRLLFLFRLATRQKTSEYILRDFNRIQNTLTACTGAQTTFLTLTLTHISLLSMLGDEHVPVGKSITKLLCLQFAGYLKNQ